MSKNTKHALRSGVSGLPSFSASSGVPGVTSELVLRSIGGAFELGGLVVVVLGINAAQKELGRPSLLTRANRWLASAMAPLARMWSAILATVRRWVDRMLHRRRSVNAHAQTAHASASLGAVGILTASGEVAINWDALSADQRVARLIARSDEHEQRLAALDDKMRSQRTELDTALVVERERAEVAEQQIKFRVDRFVGSDAQMQAIGAGLLLYGIVLTTWSGEIIRNWPWRVVVALLTGAGVVALCLLLRARSRHAARDGDEASR